MSQDTNQYFGDIHLDEMLDARQVVESHFTLYKTEQSIPAFRKVMRDNVGTLSTIVKSEGGRKRYFTTLRTVRNFYNNR
jgi:hypothetical protein